MGRKHRRHAEPPAPLTISTRDVRPAPGIKTATQRDRERQEREDRDAERWVRDQERRRQEVNQRVRWSACLVPLCDMGVLNADELPNDAEKRIPLCGWHLAMAWRQVELHEGRSGIAKATEQLAAEAAEREEAAKRRRLARQDGHIYYVRLNGLIKVGWSREVLTRLRAYGPDVEILCTHVGSRQDETTLHRNLRPFLARGREWYEDCDGMRDIVAKAVERHGRGDVVVTWSRPIEPPVKLRRRR